MARGSGPVSTTNAAPSPAARTRPSPCPTSQTTARHPGGGQPVRMRVNGAGRQTATISARAQTTHSQGRRRSLRPTGTSTHSGGGQQDTAHPAARPAELRSGQRRPRTGDTCDPLGGPSGAPRQRVGEWWGERGGGKCGEAEDGRGRHGQLGQQVAGHGDQPDPGGEHRDDRCADGLRGGRGGDHLGETGRHPTPLERGAPARCEEEQRSGRQDGQQEAVATSEPRVVEDQQQHRRGQRGEQGAAAPRTDRQKRDQPAGGGSQHTRVRPAHHHETERERTPDQSRAPQRQAQARRKPSAFGTHREVRRADQQSQDNGQVAAGDGEQMRQVSRVKGVIQLLGHPRGIADDEAGKQGAGVRAQAVGGLAEPRAQASGHPLKDRWLPDLAGRRVSCHP